jgi:ABC-type polar amino acid transport system ATPase subunit
VSRGERQRAALARALLLNPNYVFLDEITSALDVEQVAAVLGHLQLLRDRGMGILLITHLLGFARRASDHIVFLEDGQILEQGCKEILDRPQHPIFQQFLSLVKMAT